MCKAVAILLLALTSAKAFPALGEDLVYDLGDDTAVVESTVRETRAVVVPEHIDDLIQPGVKEAFLHSYGDKEGAGDGDVQGYHKTSQDKGGDGYKHFDSYHKKDGDKYGYEKSSAYGKKNAAKVANGGKKGKYSHAYENEKDHEEDAESKQAYKVVEDANEGKKGQRQALDGEYEGDSGFYADSGDAEGYSEAEAEGEGGAEEYSEGEAEADGDGESYTEYDEAEGEGYDY